MPPAFTLSQDQTLKFISPRQDQGPSAADDHPSRLRSPFSTCHAPPDPPPPQPPRKAAADSAAGSTFTSKRQIRLSQSTRPARTWPTRMTPHLCRDIKNRARRHKDRKTDRKPHQPQITKVTRKERPPRQREAVSSPARSGWQVPFARPETLPKHQARASQPQPSPRKPGPPERSAPRR